MKPEPIIVLLSGVFAVTAHMVYLLKDDRTPNHTKEDLFIKLRWHLAGGVLHVWMGYVMEIAYGPGWGLLTGATMWLVFDGAINTWVLNKEWWFIGSTAIVDKIQVWIGKWLHTDPRTISGILKCSLLVAAIINFFI